MCAVFKDKHEWLVTVYHHIRPIDREVNIKYYS